MHSPNIFDSDMHCIGRIVVVSWIDFSKTIDNIALDALCSIKRYKNNGGQTPPDLTLVIRFHLYNARHNRTAGTVQELINNLPLELRVAFRHYIPCILKMRCPIFFAPG